MPDTGSAFRRTLVGGRGGQGGGGSERGDAPVPTLPYLLCPSLFHPLNTWTTGQAWPRPDWTGLDRTGLDQTGQAWTGLAWTRLTWPGPDWPGLAWPALLLFCARSLQNPAGPAPSRRPTSAGMHAPRARLKHQEDSCPAAPEDQGTQRLTVQTLHAPRTPEACPHPRPPTRLSTATQSGLRAFSQNLKTT